MHKASAPILILSLLCTGCLVTHTSNTTHKGIEVTPETFAQIKPGSTTIGWVQATLGNPTEKTRNDNDEVWKYIFTEHTDSSGAVFLIFGGSDSTEKSETTFIEFKDGIVINKWRG
jgi:outer membrane protein assembly factor BamE (lipoprotein component of BamABCDE complex)